MENQHPDKSTSQARRQPSIGGSQTSNTSKTKSSPIKIEEDKRVKSTKQKIKN